MPGAVRLVRAGDSNFGRGGGGHHAESLTEQLTEIRRPVSWLRPRARRKTRAEPRQGDVLPFRTEQHESYRQRVAEALSAAGEALATAYPMLERIARALDADEMLKEYATEHPQPPARRSAASRPS